MRKINLFLAVSVICVSQCFFVSSVFAIFGKKKTTTAPTATVPATTQPSRWQRFKATVARKPVQPTTTPTGRPAPTAVPPATTPAKPSMWQRAKATVTRKPIQPTQPTIGAQRLPAAAPLPAPMAPTSTAVAPPPPPPPVAAPAPVPAPEVVPAPAAAPTKWWQRKPKTPRPEIGVQIGQQRPAAPTEERALVVREEETDAAVVAPAAAQPPQVPQESRMERLARQAAAAQQLTGTVVGTAAQLVGTGAQVAAMFKKPTQQPGMQPGTYPPGTYPEQYPQEMYQPVQPAAVQRVEPVAEAARFATQVAETARAIAGPPAAPLQPMPEEMQPPVSRPAQIEAPPAKPVPQIEVEREELVAEEVPVKTTEELIAEFKKLTNEIIEFKSVPAQNNIMAIVELANKAGEVLRQLNKQLDDSEKNIALIDIIEIFSGIEKMGKWAKDFGLTEDTYIGLAQTKAAKALADYVNVFEEPTEQPSGRKTIQDVQPKGELSEKELNQKKIKKVKEVKEKKEKKQKDVSVPAAMEQEEVSAAAAAV